MKAVGARTALSGLEDIPWRELAFLAAFLLVWITLRPFEDLGAADALDLGTGKEAQTYVAFALCALFCISLAASTDQIALERAASRPIICLSFWILLCCISSQNPSTSLKRATLYGCIVIIAATLPLFPNGRRRLGALLAAAIGFVLLISYLGVVLSPRFAIHQASDLAEPELAGDWRGVFEHKNTASAVFVLTAFMGLYVARARSLLLGVILVAASLIFVFFANGKTANLLWLPILGISLFVSRFGDKAFWRWAALGPFLFLNALGVGSVLFAPLGQLVQSLPIDATFTGRTEIWRYALAKLSEHPVLGFGYDAFWNTEAVRYGEGGSADAWVGAVAHAHNGFVDTAMSLGVPGLALALWAFLVQPLADIRTAVRRGADSALLMLFTQIWLFGLYASSMESFLFNRSDPVWFSFLFATFGLRYLSLFKAEP